MGDLAGYRTSFPTAALPGSKRQARPEPVGVALPGMTKAKKAAARRRKKATGYAYAPVGKPLQPAKKSARAKAARRTAKLFGGVKGGKSTTATKKAYREAQAAIKKAAQLEKVKAKPSKAASLARKAGERTAAVVAGAVGRALFPGGRTGAKRRATVARKAVELGQKALGTTIGKASAVTAAGIAAYALTRKSKLGGRAGDAIVKKYYERKDRSEAARMTAFRKAVAAERAAGTATSARVRELAATFGFSTTGS